MSRLSQSCAEATRLLSESQDTPLPVIARVGLRLHLALCRQCRRYQRQLTFMRSVFDGYADNLPAPPPLPAEFRQQLIRKLEQQDSVG